MTIPPRARRWLLMLAVPLAAAGAWRTDGGEGEPPADGRRAAAGSATSSAEAKPLPRIELERLQALTRRHVSQQPPVDPFHAALAAGPAPDPVVKRAPPAPPPPAAAPALPFRFIGRQDDASGLVVFLEQQRETHIVRIGETLAGGWRLDAVDEQALVFTYVPLGRQRRLAIRADG